MEQFQVTTPAGSALIDITRQVEDAIGRASFTDGVAALFLPHTTAALTLNENWDPDVRGDILLTLGEMAPADPRHRHSEGNSPAHIKASLLGNSLLVFVEGGKLRLGTWQGIYLAEFDGPRRRDVWLKML